MTPSEFNALHHMIRAEARAALMAANLVSSPKGKLRQIAWSRLDQAADERAKKVAIARRVLTGERD